MKRLNMLLATIGVAVAACGGGSGGDSTAVNLAPGVGAVADQRAVANQQGVAIGLSVSDEQPATVSVTASSDNPSLLPDQALVVGGSGSGRTLTATPLVDEFGESRVRIVATDSAGLTGGTAFTFTVTPEPRSTQRFVRDAFVIDPDGEPALINAVEFLEDAADDDFADLLED